VLVSTHAVSPALISGTFATPDVGRARARPFSALAEQLLEFRFRLVDFSRIGRGIRPRPRLEVIAEIRASLVAHFISRGFPAVLRDARVIVHAHLADMQLRTAFTLGRFIPIIILTGIIAGR